MNGINFTLILPDELILHIMYFMDPISVGMCRSVKKCLSRLAYDKVLLIKFPHYVLGEEVSSKRKHIIPMSFSGNWNGP